MKHYEIVAGLAENQVHNPETGRPYSTGTITNDIEHVTQAWRAEYVKERTAHVMLQLAELREARRQAWADGNMKEVRQNIRLEIDLLGTKAPDRLLVADWREEARQEGLDPDELFNDLVRQFTEAMAGTGDSGSSPNRSEGDTGTGGPGTMA
jgi:hypothetical protein